MLIGSIFKYKGGNHFCVQSVSTRWLIFVSSPFSASGYGSVIPDAPDADSHSLTKALGDKVGSYVEQYIEAMEKVTSLCSYSKIYTSNYTLDYHD